MPLHYIVLKHIPLLQYISEYLGLAPAVVFSTFSPNSFEVLLPLLRTRDIILQNAKSTHLPKTTT